MQRYNKICTFANFEWKNVSCGRAACFRVSRFHALVELGDDKTAKGGIAFLVGLGMFELALEKRLPVSEAVRVAQFLFSKRLDLLKKKAVIRGTLRPFAFVAMIDVGFAWPIDRSAFGILAIAFATRNNDTTIRVAG